MSPYVKNFIDKLTEIEKNSNAVLEVLSEYEIFQKKWLYLQSIFSQESISESLSNEVSVWKQVDKFFKQTVKMLFDNPRVWKLSLKETLRE
jgi:hypothetical protein